MPLLWGAYWPWLCRQNDMSVVLYDRTAAAVASLLGDASAPVPLPDYFSAPKEPNQQDDDGHDQQHMDEAPHRVGADHSEKPQDQQNHEKR